MHSFCALKNRKTPIHLPIHRLVRAVEEAAQRHFLHRLEDESLDQLCQEADLIIGRLQPMFMTGTKKTGKGVPAPSVMAPPLELPA